MLDRALLRGDDGQGAAAVPAVLRDWPGEAEVRPQCGLESRQLGAVRLHRQEGVDQRPQLRGRDQGPLPAQVQLQLRRAHGGEEQGPGQAGQVLLRLPAPEPQDRRHRREPPAAGGGGHEGGDGADGGRENLQFQQGHRAEGRRRKRNGAGQRRPGYGKDRHQRPGELQAPPVHVAAPGLHHRHRLPRRQARHEVHAREVRGHRPHRPPRQRGRRRVALLGDEALEGADRLRRLQHLVGPRVHLHRREGLRRQPRQRAAGAVRAVVRGYGRGDRSRLQPLAAPGAGTDAVRRERIRAGRQVQARHRRRAAPDHRCRGFARPVLQADAEVHEGGREQVPAGVRHLPLPRRLRHQPDRGLPRRKGVRGADRVRDGERAGWPLRLGR
mmetsp:Transcript_83311/g.236326  ORF Transcript_83311/g.236326 Transcript_83311/m.236326 type:complete len:384 (-) Transcript_83311:300-1451(-)